MKHTNIEGVNLCNHVTTLTSELIQKRNKCVKPDEESSHILGCANM